MARHNRTKFYVVWEGRSPGIYDNWEDAKDQIDNFPGARFKAFADQDEATAAFRGNPDDYLNLYKNLVERAPKILSYASFPEIQLNAIAVDAACSRNPGPVEYQGVDVATGECVFHYGPLEGGTNNIGEYLAIIHAAALLAQKNDSTTAIYTDSKTALSWIRNRRSKTTLTPTPENARIYALLQRADKWIATNIIRNPLLKWETERWGEIPADFGRK